MARALRDWRMSMGMSVAALAEKSGVSYATIASIETAISGVLFVSGRYTSWLLRWDSRESRTSSYQTVFRATTDSAQADHSLGVGADLSSLVACAGGVRSAVCRCPFSARKPECQSTQSGISRTTTPDTRSMSTPPDSLSTRWGLRTSMMSSGRAVFHAKVVLRGRVSMAVVLQSPGPRSGSGLTHAASVSS